MDNIDNIQLQYALASLMNGVIHLIVLVATIVLIIKKRSMATLLLFIGSLLTSLGFIGGFIYNAIAAKDGAEALLNAQVYLNFFSVFSFFLFGIGFLLLVLNNFKKKKLH